MIKVTYTADDNWRVNVANATASDPDVRKELTVKAKAIAAQAKATTGASTANSMMVKQTQRLIHVKTVKVFERVRRQPVKSRIPVALVVADHWSALWLEYGHGPKIKATHALGKAVRQIGAGDFTRVGRSAKWK
jgi:hypothetical protein